MKRWKCLCAVGCSDVKLNHLLGILHHEDAKPHYQSRHFGWPYCWNDGGDDRRSHLSQWYQHATGFEGVEHPPVTAALVLAHTYCAAVATNKFFAQPRARRAQFSSCSQGEELFCLEELRLLREKTRRLEPPSFPFGWYFAAVDTAKAEALEANATLCQANQCLLWLDGIVPDFFQKRLLMEASRSPGHPGTGGHSPSHVTHQDSHGHVVLTN